jgi:hypothetical protein
MDEGRFSISAQALYRPLGTAAAPRVIDVRRAAAFDADDRMLISAVRREPGDVGQWGRDLRPDLPVVVYCVHRIVTVTIEELRMDQGVEPHAAATASCQRAVASARKALSVDREMRWR